MSVLLGGDRSHENPFGFHKLLCKLKIIRRLLRKSRLVLFYVYKGVCKTFGRVDAL